MRISKNILQRLVYYRNNKLCYFEFFYLLIIIRIFSVYGKGDRFPRPDRIELPQNLDKYFPNFFFWLSLITIYKSYTPFDKNLLKNRLYITLKLFIIKYFKLIFIWLKWYRNENIVSYNCSSLMTWSTRVYSKIINYRSLTTISFATFVFWKNYQNIRILFNCWNINFCYCILYVHACVWYISFSPYLTAFVYLLTKTDEKQ